MAKYKLDRLVLEVTRVCNLNCKHCLKGDAQNASMSMETIYNTLANVSEVDKLVLSGGEPFIALTQLNEIADEIRKQGIKVNQIIIYTNGTVLNSDIICALEKLQMVCGKLDIRVSDDKFHRMALEECNLTNKRDNYYKVLKNLFGATFCGTPRQGGVFLLVESIGRAKYLSKEDMDKVNKYGNFLTNYILTNDPFFGDFDVSITVNPPSYVGNLNIKNVVNIDVNGYLVESYLSYEDADKRNIDGCNINKVNLLEAVRNHSEKVHRYKQKKLN